MNGNIENSETYEGSRRAKYHPDTLKRIPGFIYELEKVLNSSNMSEGLIVSVPHEAYLDEIVLFLVQRLIVSQQKKSTDKLFCNSSHSLCNSISEYRLLKGKRYPFTDIKMIFSSDKEKNTLHEPDKEMNDLKIGFVLSIPLSHKAGEEDVRLTYKVTVTIKCLPNSRVYSYYECVAEIVPYNSPNELETTDRVREIKNKRS